MISNTKKPVLQIELFVTLFIVMCSITIPAYGISDITMHYLTQGKSFSSDKDIPIDFLIKNGGAECAVLYNIGIEYLRGYDVLPTNTQKNFTLPGKYEIPADSHKSFTINVHFPPDAPPIQYSLRTFAIAEPCSAAAEPTKIDGPRLLFEITSPNNQCLIATAAYGSELAPQVQLLREIRDEKLMKTELGTAFISSFNLFYYSFSPTVAQWERDNVLFKDFVKVSITPLITSLSILQHTEMESEVNVLGYGLGILTLNIGMYFVVPALIFVKIKNQFKMCKSNSGNS